MVETEHRSRSARPAIRNSGTAAAQDVIDTDDRFCLNQGIRHSSTRAGHSNRRQRARVDLESLVVYVDYQPVGPCPRPQLLASNLFVTIIQAEIREPEKILDHPAIRRLLDMSEPVTLLMIDVLLFISDDNQPGELVTTYRRRLGTAASPRCNRQIGGTPHQLRSTASIP
ncbi:SAM-dependent methyltransferase [Lentzea sp. NPDC092896]|uniref:SAM-dependent methyltransferase n=1 Tax=Lentzea sp. NPDC092896 TaxID=3364127 RepID=UPI0038117DB6